MTHHSGVPDGVREIENVWIPMPDGCRIAARLWLPTDAEIRPVPAILEYIPYRKRDFMRSRDEPIHRYFAAHGYAAVRVDIRGSGDSDGVLDDEYTSQEHEDALAIMAWLEAQPWCDGAIGMMGISWGGFNALQVAALRPPQLKAVITLCSTDDRYADDAHYMGGCLLSENMQWGSILMSYQALPPDPEIVGKDWRETWRRRLEALEPFPALWMEHPWRDAYWKHGSVCEDFDAIGCPVYAIGGWADGYSNAIPRLLAGLSVPRKGLIGPWAHVFPHDAVPGPSIGFLQEALRWWDQWLKGADTGIMDEPMLRAWMQEPMPPLPQYEVRAGRWVAEAEWPSGRIDRRTLYLGRGRLDPAPGDDATLDIRSPQDTGVTAGEWCAMGADGEMPLDQRPDDGRSLVFDSAPLEQRLEILGAPEVTLDLAADRPVALVAVRLNDVAPDGTSTQATYGLLNLAHRGGHEHPRPLVPGQRQSVTIRLNDIAQAFPAGNRIRLAVSTCYWPMAWPPPEPVVLTVRTGASRLVLPVRAPGPLDARLRPFPPPESASTDSHRKLRALPLRRTVSRDLATGDVVYTLNSDGGEFGGASLAHLPSIDVEMGYTLVRRDRVVEDDPLKARTEMEITASLRRGDWSVRIHCKTGLGATAEGFQFEGSVDAWEGDVLFRNRSWRRDIPRKLV